MPTVCRRTCLGVSVIVQWCSAAWIHIQAQWLIIINWLYYRPLTVMFEQVWNCVTPCRDNYENLKELKILIQFKFTWVILYFVPWSQYSLSMTKYITCIKFSLGKQTLYSQVKPSSYFELCPYSYINTLIHFGSRLSSVFG